MTTEMHVDDLIGGYLLGALERDEHDRVRQHLASCEACGRAFEETRDVLATLPADVDELSPRPSVKTRLMEAAAAEARGARPAQSNVTSLAERRVRRSTFTQWAALAAAAAVIGAVMIGLTAWGITLTNRLDERDQQLAQMRELMAAIPANSAILTMEGTAAAPGVHAALVVPADGVGVYVLATDVPQPEQGQGYHLWLFRDGEPFGGVVLEPDERGNVFVPLRDIDLSQYDAMEVDVQPLGSDAPGGTTVLGGDLP